MTDLLLTLLLALVFFGLAVIPKARKSFRHPLPKASRFDTRLHIHKGTE